MKLREFNDAVIDDHALAELPRVSGDRQGIVEPEDGVVICSGEFPCEELLQNAPTFRIDEGAIMPAVLGQMYFEDCDGRMIQGCACASEALVRVCAVRFHEQNRMIFSQTREELLWPLPHPVPAQVADGDYGRLWPTKSEPESLGRLGGDNLRSSDVVQNILR